MKADGNLVEVWDPLSDGEVGGVSLSARCAWMLFVLLPGGDGGHSLAAAWVAGTCALSFAAPVIGELGFANNFRAPVRERICVCMKGISSD